MVTDINMLREVYKKRLLHYDEKIKKEEDLRFVSDFLKSFPQGEIFLVGGAVRDALLGVEEQKDYDFVVRNVDIKSLENFLKEKGKIVLVGKNFGIYKFISFSQEKCENYIDIALPRTEHSIGHGGGYKDFAVQSNPNLEIEDDLSRRDFTINAMAWNIKDKKLIDPFEGIKDIDLKVVRAVGSAKERLREDYSRGLRALRFSAQLGFDIEEETLKEVRNIIKVINKEREEKGNQERIVPFETIARELLKMFWSSPVKAFDLCEENGVFKELIPEMHTMKGCPQPSNFHSEGDVWTHTRLSLTKFNDLKFHKHFGKEKPSALVVIGVLFHDLGKPATIQIPEKDGTDRIRFDGHDVCGAKLAEQICRRLKLDSLPEDSDLRVDASRLRMIIEKHMLLIQGKIEEMRQSTIEKYFFNPNFPGKELLQLNLADSLATVPEEGEIDLGNFYAMLKRINSLKELVEEKNRLPAPYLNGDEIMKYFSLKPGKKIGKLIEALREAQLSDKIGSKDDALDVKKEKSFLFLKKHISKRI